MKFRGASAGPHETRDLILNAAEARFAERGFAGVSMREIAAEVGLKNQASLYNYFRNKRALYEAVLARGVETLVDLVASGDAPTAVSPSAATEAVLDRVVDYLVDHPHLPRLIQRAGVDDTRYLRGTATRLLRPLFQHGVGVLTLRGTPWRSEDLPHLAAGAYHLIFGYFANAQLLQLVTQEDPLSPAAVARQRRFIKTAVAQLLGDQPQARPRSPRAVRRLRAATR